MARVRPDNDARYALRATFVDDSGSVIETDTIAIGAAVTSAQITNWDTAYSWGDHSTEGYYVNSTGNNLLTRRITFSNQEDTVVTADGQLAFDLNDTSAGATLGTYGGSWPSGWYFYSGGNVGRFWTDEHFSGTNVSNWQTAYGWGDHSTEGYWQKGADIPGSANLNNYTTAGFYHQNLNANASSGSNYPTAAAGMLEVTNDGAMIYQRYTIYNSGQIYTRSYYNGTWYSWRQVWDSRTFTSTNISNWNTAYNWGNHASGGYAPLLNPNFTGDVGFTNQNTNQVYFSFIGGACKRLTTQGGLVIGVDSSVILHAGDQVNTLKGTYGIVDGTTAETLYLTADGEVNIDAGHQTTGGSTVWRWQFQSDGWLQMARAAGVANTSYTWMKAGAPYGDYGSVTIDGGGTNSYEGFSIGGRAVFMHNNNTVTGIYNDVNNHWLLRGDHNGPSYMYQAGVIKGYTYASGFRVTGNLLATSNVYAYYSDERLKTFTGAIESPLEKIAALHGVYYTHNDKARELGYEGSETQVGLIAQEVKAVMPECIGRAPIDDDGEGGSVSGEDYMTVDYPRLVPLLVEGIKELTREVEQLKEQLNALR